MDLVRREEMEIVLLSQAPMDVNIRDLASLPAEMRRRLSGVECEKLLGFQ